MIKEKDKLEFLGQIIDIFEDFLADNGVKIPACEQEKAEDEDQDDNDVVIYGSSYYQLEDELKSMMIQWGVMQEEA